MIHKLLKRPQAIIGLCLIAIVIVIAIAAPAFSPHDPELVNLSQKYAQPDAEYPLGTDQLGRCTLSRLLYGARYSIGISLPVLLILSVIGLIVGTFSACAGEKADHFITILCDVFIAFPSLIIAIAVIGSSGERTPKHCRFCCDSDLGLVCSCCQILFRSRNGKRLYLGSSDFWVQYRKAGLQTSDP